MKDNLILIRYDTFLKFWNFPLKLNSKPLKKSAKSEATLGCTALLLLWGKQSKHGSVRTIQTNDVRKTRKFYSVANTGL